MIQKPKWWCFTVWPKFITPGSFTIVMVAITLPLYIFFRTHQCDVHESANGKHPDLTSYYVDYPKKYHFVLDQPKKCQNNPFLVIIVLSAPDKVMERNAIRNTWGDVKLVKENIVVVLFLMGLPSGEYAKYQQARVHQENIRHQDLLQSNFIESSKNVTIKTMVMLEWLRDHCPQAYFAAKVNEDILLNVRALISMLLSLSTPWMNYIIGEVVHDNPDIKNRWSDVYLPHEVYPNLVFPSYPLGKCFIMSTDMPEKILQASREIKAIYKDDLYIGLCLQWLQIPPTKLPNPKQFELTPPETYSRCHYSGLTAVSTFSPVQMVSIWKDLLKPGPHC